MKVIKYFNDVYNELLHKVSWPTWGELQSSSVVVMIASLIIAMVVFIMDYSFEHILGFIYGMFY
ncbi:MAG: preprotein translocase subunit SecE [Bacteroidetes bacterium]|nr:preprotein translocase subunit SecE [Bacteroidota bacterium]